MYRRPETQLARPEADDNPLTVTPKLEEWHPDALMSFTTAMHKTLPNGKNREFFAELRRELSRFSSPGFPATNETIVLHPILLKFADSPIIIDPATIKPNVQVIVSSHNSPNAFRANTKVHSGFVTLFDNESELITYKEAYKRLKLPTIASLTIKMT